ncbi:metalloregulator ArsR/SmtB family transcription factor [Brevundimonas albigilva]|jgi:DNA-binding transcriptional ArsR family regulator|uniref:ArsR/SmtB family transcription factor n=1 Tax=Brevundimonas TaxID=41275 RepID=UPI000DB5CA8C|nr:MULTISPECIES: metalloregulator ArsR/SmtB family transcription factor [Brevundimonas]PZU75241.1 MAG: transcriptional regulator [Brevundimonas sp.]UQV18371.1 metalloregulator ArsR/SmtB family transcription factor [Brevundimonas albigilva]
MANSPHAAILFSALGDRTRLAVVERLVRGPASVSELSAPFDMAAPSFLKHLRVLEEAGLVTSEKRGRVRTVHLSPDALDWVENWVTQHRRGWAQRLDDLGQFLKQGNN